MKASSTGRGPGQAGRGKAASGRGARLALLSASSCGTVSSELPDMAGIKAAVRRVHRKVRESIKKRGWGELNRGNRAQNRDEYLKSVAGRAGA